MTAKQLQVDSVSTADELLELVNSLTNTKEDDDGEEYEDQAMETTKEAAQEAIEMARFRQDMGSEDYLIIYPEWLTGDSRWGETPTAIYAFAEVEFDGEDKRAVLFDSVREIDDNIIQNNAWSRADLSLSEAIELIDLSEDSDGYVDDPGLMWVPRDYMRCVLVEDE